MSAADGFLRGIRSGCSLASVALVAVLALGEIGGRWWLDRWADDDAFRRYASYGQLVARHPPRLVPHRHLGYVPAPGWRRGADHHNAQGYRGASFARDKPAGELRIVCLGGSTTYTVAVEDPRDSYPARLEDALHAQGVSHARVINAGVAGWTSRESLIAFQLRVLDLDPDVVVVLHGINDVHPRLVWPAESYRGDGSGMLAPVALWSPPALWRRSSLVRMLAVRAGWVAPDASLGAALARPRVTYHGDTFRRQVAQDRYPSNVFEETPAEAMLAANPPRYLARNLRSLVASAQAHGVVPVLATFAFAAADAFPDQPRVASSVYRRALDEHNHVVRTVAAETGTTLVDLARTFPDDPTLYTDGRHVDARGATIRARLVAKALLRAGLPTPTPEPPRSPSAARP